MSGFFRVFKAGAIRVLKFIARVLAFILCVLFYYLLVGPYSLVIRLAKGDVLEKSPDPEQPSYWVRLDPSRPRPERPF